LAALAAFDRFDALAALAAFDALAALGWGFCIQKTDTRRILEHAGRWPLAAKRTNPAGFLLKNEIGQRQNFVEAL